LETLRITLGFGPFGGSRYSELTRQAQALPGYRRGSDLEPFEQAVEGTVASAGEMLSLYRSARVLGPVTVLVNGHQLPYGEELWLPLLWFFLSEYHGPISFEEARVS
jgi:hypothetical protein